MEEHNTTAPLPPDEDLTEVRKPASLLVAQFFVFPLIIIGICVGIFMLFGYLTLSQSTAADYVKDIRNGAGKQRWQAAYELSILVKANLKSHPERVQNPEFIETLQGAYKDSRDEDIPVRGYLAAILGELKARSAVPLLTEGLQRDEKLKSKDWSQDSLLDFLRPSLDKIQEQLIQNQIYTLWALGSIGDNSAVPVVLEYAKHQEVSVRNVAAYVLGTLKDERAVDALRVLLNDSNDDVKWNAALALAQLNNAEGADLMMKSLDPGYVDTLPKLSAEQKAELRVNAIKGLGMLRHEPAKETIRALSKNDPVLVVREASMEALKKY
jgi:HEAT repeat protein